MHDNMHDIKELERQYKAAQSRLDIAKDDARSAADRLRAAHGAKLMADFAAMGGVVGVTRVRLVEWNGSASTSGPFFVMGWRPAIYGPDARYDLAKIKKDGTPSNAPTGSYATKIVILPEDQPNE